MILWLLHALAAGALLVLRVTPTGAFPRTLTKEEEDKYVALAAQGDRQARDKLVEHKQYIHTYGVDLPEISGWKWED